jgi:hypothetical protein
MAGDGHNRRTPPGMEEKSGDKLGDLYEHSDGYNKFPLRGKNLRLDGWTMYVGDAHNFPVLDEASRDIVVATACGKGGKNTCYEPKCTAVWVHKILGFPWRPQAHGRQPEPAKQF